ncbi:MAG TPA: polynucleotide adenylyltransferase PcnB [Thermoanaerobaculia bacterium]|nr:polynucleotide adenylyltransferase PcnB [Thermoanaerobaculia bacterium]
MSSESGQEPRVLDRPEHSISRDNIPENTLKVLYRLNNAGKKAYLVGGAVRDLLLGREPKDFDVGTDARPAEIRRLFRNSRIIGRRFRLAHVFFQDGIVEVATFRREPSEDEQESGQDELLITSDNTYGTPREDAFRRDFTINALFYSIADFSVIDYVGGIDDLDDGLIRVIGDPDVRFREDPVRMLRAIEFAARLKFDVEPATAQGIVRTRGEMAKASSARVTEEIVQLLQCGHAGDALQLMLDFGLLEELLPEVDDMVAAYERGLGKFNRIPLVFDELVEEGREVSEAALLAAILLPRVLLRRYDIEGPEGKGRPLGRGELEALVDKVAEPFIARFTLSRARADRTVGALKTFLRLCEPEWTEENRRRFTLRKHFDDALLLLEILARATGEGLEAVEAWQKAAENRPEPHSRPSDGRARPRRRRRKRRRR